MGTICLGELVPPPGLTSTARVLLDHTQCEMASTTSALKLAIAIALFVSPLLANAQTGTIAGTVIDAATRRPLEGAVVSVVGTSYGTHTRVNGAFTILGVPPGVYAISARRFGFATHELTGIDVQIGRTRTLSIILHASTSDTTERTEVPPLFVDPGTGGTAIALSNAQMVMQPSLTMSGALASIGGYLELPRATAALSLADLRRGVTGVTSVRAGRADATQYLLEGIPVGNPLFGSPPLLLEPFGAAGVMFSPAYVDPEHGGALSGLVNQAIREGGARMSGAFEYQTSGIAGALGSATSGESDTYVARSFLAGPVPVVGSAFRFSLAGHVLGERANVIKPVNGPWNGSGDNANDQLVAKLTYAARPTWRLSVAALAQRRVVLGIDPDFPVGDSVAPGTVRDDARFIVARFEKRFADAQVSISLAENRGWRESCSIWQGVCAMDRFARNPQGAEIPGFGMPTRLTPYVVSGQYFGSEAVNTHTARADAIITASDHHQLGVGVYAARHEIAFRDATGYRWLQGTVLTSTDAYRASPFEFASYVQDAIQFDLITIHLGARFEYARPGGVAFVDPLNPTNGTTAREVCQGMAPGINDTPYTYGGSRGLAACLLSPSNESGRPFLLDSAARLAQRDDMRAVRPRTSFEPRIGLSFPVTERSGMFLNIGRYTRRPLYNDAFRNTGLGSRAGLANTGGDGMCASAQARPGTSECAPNLQLDRSLPEFVGNPDLSFEKADAWEAGFTSQVGRAHSLDVSLFSSTQSYLPSVYTSVLSPDIGLTYGVLGQSALRTVLSRASISSLGISVTVRRRAREGPLSYTINYSWERSREIGAPPDLIAEALVAGEIVDNAAEHVSSRNRTNTLNALFSWQWRAATPTQLGSIGAAILRNSRTVVTVSAASGSQPPSARQPVCNLSDNTPCAPFAGGIAGTGTLVNLLYVRSLAINGGQWSLMIRVRNLLDADDGSATLVALDARRRAAAGARLATPRQQVSLRRLLVGLGVNF